MHNLVSKKVLIKEYSFNFKDKFKFKKFVKFHPLIDMHLIVLILKINK